MNTMIKKTLQNLLELSSHELDDIIEIIMKSLVLETGLDVIGSLDPTLIAGLGMEIPEIGLDIVMCIRIWQYFKQENLDDSNKFAFMDSFNSYPLEAAKSGILAYGITSLLKFIVGKGIGKGALYIGSPLISGGINALQTITTGLLWAKHAKRRINLNASLT